MSKTLLGIVKVAYFTCSEADSTNSTGLLS